MTGRYMTPAEVAARWCLSTREVQRMATTGVIAFFRVGRQIRISEDTVMSFERSHTMRAQSSPAGR